MRASVRTRIQEINKKSASPGKFPQLKQTKLLDYLKRKSPKAMKARESLKQESEAEPTKLQGALKSPLSGDLIHPGPENQSSEGPGPAPVVRGGVWEGGGRKKALKALEKWPLALKASPGGLGKIRSNKRLQDTQGGKEIKSRKVLNKKAGSREPWRNGSRKK